MQRRLKTDEEDTGLRLDQFLARETGMTRSACQKLLEQGLVTAAGKTAGKNDRLRPGMDILVELPEPREDRAAPEEIPLEVVYEDGQLLVVNKPKGMVVHPAAGHAQGTLVNALLHHCAGQLSGINGVIRPGIVHRIDKDTSGLLLVAKTDLAHLSLAEQIKEHSLTRRYETVVLGHLPEESGRIELPIGRHPTQRKKMAVTEENSRNAVTHYRVLEEYPGYSYLECTLETGRTHQIRVHLSHLGHPVLGDTVYGPKKGYPGLEGQCLHARTVGFRHPVTGEYLEFHSELPPYFTEVLEKLRRSSR